jgi:hypothetical protein
MLYIIMTNTARPFTSSFFLVQPSSLFLATVHAVIHIIDIQQEPSGMESESRRSSLSQANSRHPPQGAMHRCARAWAQ